MIDIITNLLQSIVHNQLWLEIISILVILVSILLVAYLAFSMTHLIIKKMIQIRTHRGRFIKVIIKYKVQNLISHIMFAFVLLYFAKFILEHNKQIYLEGVILAKFAGLYLFFTCVMVITRLVSSLNGYYNEYFESAKEHPIYSYTQVINLFIWVVSVVLLISLSLDISLVTLLTGLGAASAVFLLIFKDTLLGIMSSIQATALNLVRIGDRITIDNQGVDGIVIDISISTVKIRNADNTIAYLPTYMITSSIVKNWRFMQESGARRIKRSIYLDPDKIKICDDKLHSKLLQNSQIAKYLNKYDESVTNLMLYRMYLMDYLCNSLEINKEYPIMVRHLESSGSGLPLEIYAYTYKTDIVSYEHVQADIFEHAYVMLALFDLDTYKSSN